MAVPKRRQSHRRSALRRNSAWTLDAKNLVKCPNCGEMMVPHRMCDNCGHYDKKEIKEVKKDK